ncbi:glycosyltransferase [Dyadobacter sandarakinus]|uniref:Glycosyltransferase n=1 Tax=Dyadobacter sandarakinus TaxID=2747268 RepID=A0ABX7I7E0_9BACT|nr:glycosyltransferase [Dyadobacter sandarakinus]QRR01462.1 glycosyltransferase [Dyadobacter sandarakinus]
MPEPQNLLVENTTLSFYSGSKYDTNLAYKVCVIVPVRNEADHLHQTLEALRIQLGADQIPLPQDSYEVLVLVNNSSDESLAIARRYADTFPDFAMSVANIDLTDADAHIGTVRRLLMDEAYTRLTKSCRKGGIIASTDGDTMVDKHWITRITAEIDRGNDAVGGRILTRPERGDGRAYHLRDVTYRCLLAQAECMIDPLAHNPYPCHHQYFGANFAVTAKMYAQAGRLPIVPFLEDVAFHKALISHDARIRNSFDVKVYTSSRRDGRVHIGFSEQLRRWQHDEKLYQMQMVEDVQVLLHMYQTRSILRKMWSSYQQTRIVHPHDVRQAASMLEMDLTKLENLMVESAYFGQFWHTLLQVTAHSQNRTVTFQPIKQAIMQLRKFVKDPALNASQKSPADRFPPANFAPI